MGAKLPGHVQLQAAAAGFAGGDIEGRIGRVGGQHIALADLKDGQRGAGAAVLAVELDAGLHGAAALGVERLARGVGAGIGAE
ncbi:hypothetical protein D9M73_245900 [compost metagenome]